MLTKTTANALCALYGALYVSSLYLLVPSNVKLLPRGHPLQIKYRMSVTLIATILSMVIVYFVVSWNDTSHDFWTLIGRRLDTLETLFGILVTVLLMTIFYLGPVLLGCAYFCLLCYYEFTLDGNLSPRKQPRYLWDGIRDTINRHCLAQNWVVTVRNLYYAPISEEIVFRGLVLSTLSLAYRDSLTNTNGLFLLACGSTLWFGIAHVHHFYEKVVSGIPVTTAILSTVVQFVYTSIFGIIAALLFLRTNNLLACIASHIVCNYMGLPDIGFFFPSASYIKQYNLQLAQQQQEDKTVKQSKLLQLSEFCNEYSAFYPYRYLIAVLHIGGLALFGWCLYPFTERFTVSSVYWQA